VSRVEEFEELRPLLFSISYRMLGSVSEAEDAVQETWLRYQASPTPPVSTKAFLSAVVTRISIDVLRSARVRREEYVGPWFPEPLLTDPYQDPERSAELADSVSMAALLLLERLGRVLPVLLLRGGRQVVAGLGLIFAWIPLLSPGKDQTRSGAG
jgi:RNA polymerase sigma-70 factor (ECF subfamily)